MGEPNCPYLTNLHYAIMLSVKTDGRELREVEYLTVLQCRTCRIGVLALEFLNIFVKR